MVTASLLNLASRLIEKDSHAGQAGSNQTEGGRPERLTQSATITTGFLSHVLFSGKLVKLHESSGKSAEVGYESGCSPNGGQFDLAENLDPAPIPDNPVATTDVSYIAKELAWLSAETSLMLAASPDDNTVPLALPFAWVHGSLPMRRRIATQFPHQTHRAAMNGKMIIIDGRKLLLDDASAESISHLRAEAVAGMRLGFYRKASVQETIERSVSSRQGGSGESASIIPPGSSFVTLTSSTFSSEVAKASSEISSPTRANCEHNFSLSNQNAKRIARRPQMGSFRHIQLPADEEEEEERKVFQIAGSCQKEDDKRGLSEIKGESPSQRRVQTQHISFPFISHYSYHFQATRNWVFWPSLYSWLM